MYYGKRADYSKTVEVILAYNDFSFNVTVWQLIVTFGWAIVVALSDDVIVINYPWLIQQHNIQSAQLRCSIYKNHPDESL